MSSSVRTLTYDIFLSHERADDAIVTELAQALTQMGFRVWLDLWELVPGAPISSAVSDAVSEARVFAVCVGARRSKWGDVELETALAAKAAQRPDLRILAILLPGAGSDAIPAPLQQFQALDLTEGMTAVAIENVAAAVGGRDPAQPGRDEASPERPSRLAEVDFEQLLRDADQALVDDPDNLAARKARVAAYLNTDRAAEALDDLDLLLAADPADVMTLLQKAAVLAQLGRTGAMKELAQSIAANAESVVTELERAFGSLSVDEMEALAVDTSVAQQLAGQSAVHRIFAVLQQDRESAVRYVKAEAASIEAQALVAEGDFDAAIDRLRYAIDLDTGQAPIRIQLFEALAQAGRTEEIAAMTRELELAAERPAELIPLAVAKRAGGDLEGAIALLDRSVELDPADPIARAIRSETLARMGRFGDAATDLQVVVEDNPSNWVALNRLIALYRVIGDLDGEARALDVLADNVGRALPSLLRSQPVKDGELTGDDVIQIIEENATEVATQFRAQAATLRVKSLWRQGRRADALHAAFADIVRWPQQYTTWASAVMLLAEEPDLIEPDVAGVDSWIVDTWQALRSGAQGEAGAAVAALSSIVAAEPDVGVVRWLRGAMLWDGGDAEAAVADFALAAELDPAAPAPRISRGDALSSMGRLEDALVAFNEVLIDLAAGADREIYFKRAEVRRRLGLYQAAIADLEHALRMPSGDPGLVPVLVGTRGQARLGLDDLDGALEDLNAALAANPNMAWALASRAFVHLARHDVDAAIEDRQQIVALVPGDPYAWSMYASMLLETGQAERLWSELSTAVADHAELAASSLIQGALGDAALRTQRYAEAEEAFGRAATLEPSEDFYLYEQARAMRHQGRAADAEAVVREALARVTVPPTDSPSHWTNRFNQALYLLAAGEDDEAVGAYRDLLSDLDDLQPATVGLSELNELQQSGYWSPAAEIVRSQVRDWIEEHRALTAQRPPG